MQRAVQTHKDNMYNVRAGLQRYVRCFLTQSYQPQFCAFNLSFFFFKAIYGQAIDRHLLGLKMQGIEDLTSMPEIFMDTSFAVAQHFNLSTSQVHLHLRKFAVYHCRANDYLPSYLFFGVFFRSHPSPVCVSRSAPRQTV